MSHVLIVLVCLVFVLIGQGLAVSAAASAEAAGPWPPVALAKARDVELRGPLGDALRRGVARIDMAPYTVAWILADLSFEVDRRYTNFSGDVSGRFVELATLTSPPGQPSRARPSRPSSRTATFASRATFVLGRT